MKRSIRSAAMARPGWGLPAAALVAVLWGAADPALAEAPVALAPHRAVYDLTLVAVTGGDTISASGTMTYAVSDACSAWSTQQQLKLQTVSRSGSVTEMVSDYATLEAKDGHDLVFQTVQTTNGHPASRVTGEATMTPTGGEIRYTQPRAHTITLPAGTLFPMAHTRAIISAGERGQASLAPSLFDGTGEDGPQDTYIMILGWHQPPTASPFPALARLPSGRVHVAFYTAASHDMRPDYEIGMRYFANGVSDDLDMDFGDFRMHGTLHSFTPAPEGHRC
ncbi:cell envelope integrity EipB family protein [Gluconacetobacter takamatsuzukensis]|nr:cell envelope integrity EipB family protein [Gluconacetobacter takamatsuzukensis]